MDDPLAVDDDVEGDLMAAMNAALEDSNHSRTLFNGSETDTASLRSIDVMGEAMGLLMSVKDDDGLGVKEISIGAGDDDDDDEEEINFDDFMAGTTTSNDESNDDNEINSGGSNSPTSAVDGDSGGEEPKEDVRFSDSSSSSAAAAAGSNDTENDNGSEAKESKKNHNNNNAKSSSSTTTTGDDGETTMVAAAYQIGIPQVVPLKQFENALALIQDLENRIQVLETDQECMIEENNILREGTLNQATMLANLEAKLAEFPKLLEQTVQEEARVAAAKAEEETKFSFWRKDMARQEKEVEEEKLKRTRKHAATTDSLRQADFLKDVVNRKEEEERSGAGGGGSGLLSLVSSSPDQSPVTTEPVVVTTTTTYNNNNKRQGPFSFLRGWGNKNNNNNSNNGDGNSETPDNGDVSAGADEKDDEGEIKTSTSSGNMTEHENRSSSRPTMLDKEEDSNDTNNAIEDLGHDEKMLSLLT